MGNFKRIDRDEGQIAQALATYGPLAIAVDANGFNGYNDGVMDNPSCSQSRNNHAVNFVGYGTDSIPYWKIRNSWGTNFGEAGYIRLVRGKCACGSCTEVTTATGEHFRLTTSSKPSFPAVAAVTAITW